MTPVLRGISARRRLLRLGCLAIFADPFSNLPGAGMFYCFAAR
jgi:hypothetical protein